jgi:hypothetical protein
MKYFWKQHELDRLKELIDLKVTAKTNAYYIGKVFVMIGQTREDTCEHCKKTIYFDKKGNSFQYDFKKMTTCSGKVL